MMLPRGHKKDSIAIWDTPAAEELGFCWTWTWLELFWNWIAHPQKNKQQANRPQGTRAHKEVQKVTKTWTNAPRPEQFHKSSSQVQVQDNPKNQVPRTCNKQTWYDPQLQRCLIWLCHLSHDPLAATSLDHLHTLVQQGYNNVQVTYKNIARPSQKTEQWKLSTS